MSVFAARVGLAPISALIRPQRTVVRFRAVPADLGTIPMRSTKPLRAGGPS
jgi:hypothetical protein